MHQDPQLPPQLETPQPARPRTGATYWLLLGLTVSLWVLPSTASAQSLVTLRNIEMRLLEAKLAEFRAAHDAETAADREAGSVNQQLRSALGNLEVPVERLRNLESALAVARGVADRRQVEAARLRHEIYDRMERLGEIERELGEAGVTEWGTWTLDFGPDEGPGRVTLRTEAGRVEGQYVMQSGRRGTVRGSLTGRRLQLERIDTERGRDRTMEATLTPDGRQLQGTWVASELASGEQTSGVWRAVKVADP